MAFETISVIGLGYIGLPTAAMFASCKKKVIGVDVNEGVVKTINQGEIHIVEPDLAGLVKEAVDGGYFQASLTAKPADAFLIAVPTPFNSHIVKGVPEPDLRYVEAAASAIAPVLKKGDLVVLESTSPVGTTEKMAGWLSEARPDLSFPHQSGEEADIHVAHCPERVLPGQVVKELVENDRVIGGLTPKCAEVAVELYKTFVKGECVITNSRTAEMAKLTENSCRDVQIAFANELSVICDELGIDVWELINLANRHPRINILQPGPGVGGHCIAVDPWFIVSRTPELARLIHTARQVNDSKPEWVLNKVKMEISNFLQAHPSKTIKEVTIVCYGLAFKPDIDDLRESPSLSVAKSIAKMHSGNVIAVEPNVEFEMVDGLPLVSLESAMVEGDVHVLLVDHKEFKLDMKSPSYLVDTKGLWI